MPEPTPVGRADALAPTESRTPPDHAPPMPPPPAPHAAPLADPHESPPPTRWMAAWWRRQSPGRQDRLASLMPMLAVLLFLAAIAAAFTYLRAEENDREVEAVKRDVEYAQQRIRLRVLERQEQVMRLARDISNGETDDAAFMDRAEALITQNPELKSLTWVGRDRKIIASQDTPTPGTRSTWQPGDTLLSPRAKAAFQQAEKTGQEVYSTPTPPVPLAEGQVKPALLQLQVPITDKGDFNGVLLAEFSIDRLLRYGVPSEVFVKYALTMRAGNGNLLAGDPMPERQAPNAWLPGAFSQWLGTTSDINEHEVPVSPVGNQLVLRAQAWRTAGGVVGSGFFWLASALSALTAWMLFANWRHLRVRMRTQRDLVRETAFRSAMENSMPTGMRALDLTGRITYVNKAYCQMTGWSAQELIGLLPPFPFWPDEDIPQLSQWLSDELAGRTMPGGLQVRVKRKNGSLFDARVYVSPLIDANGQHTGWMTSMSDITEPNRIRAQLATSHERFTTVLEAMDASISVTPLGSRELLYANKLYQQWFGRGAEGHMALIHQAATHPQALVNDITDDEARGGDADDGPSDVDDLMGLPTDSLTSAQAEHTEVYLAESGRWLEVRSRYLNWVDGRLAQMLIATDITARHTAEELAAAQAEKAQSASRLITMGEMASSVAHELNQPLSAISNYCSGMISRIRSQQIDNDDLLGALDKTARQAQRAGQIIQRIRSFVKRSAPNRTLSDVQQMVDEALELVSIELRRRNVRLAHHIASRVPPLHVDPILIEQVLVNLIKNAAEAIDHAHMPPARRNVELRVVPKTVDDAPVVEFSVTDTGAGLPPDVLSHLFEAFYTTKAEGMGIGLNLCRSIVESHQGRMKADNLYNGDQVTGCRFTFWLPVDAPAQAPSSAVTTPSASSTDTPPRPPQAPASGDPI